MRCGGSGRLLRVPPPLPCDDSGGGGSASDALTDPHDIVGDSTIAGTEGVACLPAPACASPPPAGNPAPTPGPPMRLSENGLHCAVCDLT